MAQSECYSIRDLANISGQPETIVTGVVNFLNEYGFVKKMGTTEPLYRKSPIVISPTQSLNILECMVNK